MAEADPDYVSSDCPIAGRRIEQGIDAQRRVARAQGASAHAAAHRLRARLSTRRRASAMPRITRESLMTLEAYAKARKEFRAQGDRAQEGAHRAPRRARDAARSRTSSRCATRSRRCCASRRSSRRRASRTSSTPTTRSCPTARNFKATMLIEYEDVDERKRALARLKGIEDRVWVAGRGLRDVSSRSPTRTSSARPTRRRRPCTSCASSSTPAMVAALKRGAALGIGVDHPGRTRRSLDARPRDARGARRAISPRRCAVGAGAATGYSVHRRAMPARQRSPGVSAGSDTPAPVRPRSVVCDAAACRGDEQPQRFASAARTRMSATSRSARGSRRRRRRGTGDR